MLGRRPKTDLKKQSGSHKLFLVVGSWCFHINVFVCHSAYPIYSLNLRAGFGFGHQRQSKDHSLIIERQQSTWRHALNEYIFRTLPAYPRGVPELGTFQNGIYSTLFHIYTCLEVCWVVAVNRVQIWKK